MGNISVIYYSTQLYSYSTLALYKSVHYYYSIIFLCYICADDEGNNTWPEILKFLFDCASSGNVELKESALIIFR